MSLSLLPEHGADEAAVAAIALEQVGASVAEVQAVGAGVRSVVTRCRRPVVAALVILDAALAHKAAPCRQVDVAAVLFARHFVTHDRAGDPHPRAIVTQFLHLGLGGHTPIAAPVFGRDVIVDVARDVAARNAIRVAVPLAVVAAGRAFSHAPGQHTPAVAGALANVNRRPADAQAQVHVAVAAVRARGGGVLVARLFYGDVGHIARVGVLHVGNDEILVKRRAVRRRRHVVALSHGGHARHDGECDARR